MTPDFPLWADGFARNLRQLRSVTGSNIHQFQLLFGSWISHWHLAQQDDGRHSRDRCWNLRLVFWTFLWQVAHPGASCREAIRQAQALCQIGGRRLPPDSSSPYCQARGNLPLERLQQIHHAVVKEAETAISHQDLWNGHRVLVGDGSTVTVPDTPENQKRFPQQSVQKPGCGFPIIRLAALLNLATGMLAAWTTGHWHQHELVVFQQLWDYLRPKDVLLGDRGFCNWGLIAQCMLRDVHAVFRVKGSSRRDFRRGQRLSQNERLVKWRKSRKQALTIPPKEWVQLPEELTLRLVRCCMGVPGFRTRKVILVTTLLDSKAYPPSALSRLYFRRWAMELSLRNLKITLQMDQLSCKNPENLEREIHMHFLIHNLVRRLMLEASRRHGVALQKISFAGALASARRYAEALLQARSKKGRQNLLKELFRVLADDQVPERPGRREPRAIKRRPKPYPLLTRHRRSFLEISHRNRYYANSVFGPKYRKSPKP